MSTTPTELSESPTGFHRFGWGGIPLILPEAWNLRLHGGTDREGALIFSDLRTTRLELRWRIPPLLGRWGKCDPAPLLEKTLSGLTRRYSAGRASRLSANAVRFDLRDEVFVLVAQGQRLFELHWPEKPEKRFVDPILADFLRTLPLADVCPERFWSVYGATGWVPRTARLKKISLLPGATTLRFADRRESITLGAVSLADRLLADGRNLRAWATSAIPLIARCPSGRWEESPAQSTFTAEARRRFRPAHHLLILRHDAAANRIAWTHHLGPASG